MKNILGSPAFWGCVVAICGVGMRAATLQRPPPSLMSAKREADRTYATAIRQTVVSRRLVPHPEVNVASGQPSAYPLWLALTGHEDRARWGQGILAGLACALAVWIGKWLGSVPAGVGAGLMLACAPPLRQHINLPLAESMMSPLWTGIVAALVYGMRHRSFRATAVVGVLSGLLFQFRAEYLPVPLALAFVGLCTKPTPARAIGHVCVAAGAWLVAALTPLLVLWIVTNARPPLMPYREDVRAFNFAFALWEVENASGEAMSEDYSRGSRWDAAVTYGDSDNRGTAMWNITRRLVAREPLVLVRAALARALRITAVPFLLTEPPAHVLRRVRLHIVVVLVAVAWLGASRLPWAVKLALTLPWWATICTFLFIHVEARYYASATWSAYFAAGWVLGRAAQILRTLDWTALHDPRPMRGILRLGRSVPPTLRPTRRSVFVGAFSILAVYGVIEIVTTGLWRARRSTFLAAYDSVQQTAPLRSADELWPTTPLTIDANSGPWLTSVDGLKYGRGHALMGRIHVLEGGALIQLVAEDTVRQTLRLPEPGTYLCSLPADGHGPHRWQVRIQPDGPYRPTDQLMQVVRTEPTVGAIRRWLRRCGDVATLTEPFGRPGGSTRCRLTFEDFQLYDIEARPHLPYAHRLKPDRPLDVPRPRRAVSREWGGVGLAIARPAQGW